MLLPDRLQSISDLEDVGEVFLGVTCDSETEIALLEVLWSFLPSFLSNLSPQEWCDAYETARNKTPT